MWMRLAGMELRIHSISTYLVLVHSNVWWLIPCVRFVYVCVWLGRIYADWFQHQFVTPARNTHYIFCSYDCYRHPARSNSSHEKNIIKCVRVCVCERIDVYSFVEMPGDRPRKCTKTEKICALRSDVRVDIDSGGKKCLACWKNSTNKIQ